MLLFGALPGSRQMVSISFDVCRDLPFVFLDFGGVDYLGRYKVP